MDNERAMSEFLNEANSILMQIKTHQSVHEQQLEMYKEIVNTSIAFNKERMDLFEKRWATMRSILIGFMGLFLLSFISDRIELQQRPTTEEIEDVFLEKEDAYRGFGIVIDDVYDILYLSDILTHDEADELSTQTKKDVLKEVEPNYVERSIKVE